MSPASSGGSSPPSTTTSSSSSSPFLLFALGALTGAASALAWRRLLPRDGDRWSCADERASIADGVAGLVGHTPLVRIRSLSEATGCEVS
jgi:hypothetical protein